jgi:hypothetical protein
VPASLSDEQVLFLSDIFPTGYMAADFCNLKGGDRSIPPYPRSDAGSGCDGSFRGVIAMKSKLSAAIAVLGCALAVGAPWGQAFSTS